MLFPQNNGKAIIPYGLTGIVKGRWNKDVVYDLFRNNGVKIDFSKRGFFNPDDKSIRGHINNIFEIVQKIRARLPW